MTLPVLPLAASAPRSLTPRQVERGAPHVRLTGLGAQPVVSSPVNTATGSGTAGTLCEVV